MKIKEICVYGIKSKIKAGEGLEEGMYKFFTSSSEVKKFVDNHQFSKPGIIMGTGGNATLHYCDEPFSVSTDCLVLFPSNIVRAKFLYYFLKGNFRMLQAGFKGAGLKHTSKKYINEISVKNIPEIIKQESIIKILDNVETLINLKKEQLIEYDQLIKSRFFEMFGDPVINEMEWQVNPIFDLVSSEKNALKAGPFGSSLKKEFYVEKGYKIYGQEQVISGDVKFGNYYIDEDRFNSLRSCAIQYDDVLISLVGTYGKLLIIPKEYESGIINPRLMKITFDKDLVNTIYFKYFFQTESLKNRLTEITHGGTMPILNLSIVKNIEMPYPPIELQKQFADFVKQVDKLKFAVQKSLDKTQILFDSLMQEYFG